MVTIPFYMQHNATVYEVTIDEYYKGIYLDKVYFLDVEQKGIVPKLSQLDYFIFNLPIYMRYKLKISRFVNLYFDPFETVDGYNVLITGFYDTTEPELTDYHNTTRINDLNITGFVEVNSTAFNFDSWGTRQSGDKDVIIVDFGLVDPIQFDTLESTFVTLKFNNESHTFKAQKIETKDYSYFNPLYIRILGMTYNEADEVLEHTQESKK